VKCLQLTSRQLGLPLRKYSTKVYRYKTEIGKNGVFSKYAQAQQWRQTAVSCSLYY